MAQEDKERWDAKYKNSKIAQKLSTPITLLQNYNHLATGKKALDIACGVGRHSKYLASEGFVVDALDISSVAIAQLQDTPYINAIEVDFDTYTLEKGKYDLIVCTYYLERTLFSQMIAALKPNGIIIFETFLHDERNESSPSNPTFLLDKGELENYFTKTCKLVYMREWFDIDYKGNEVMKASMVARKFGP